MFFKRLDSIFGTARMKPAIPAHQRTDCQPIDAHYQNKQFTHWTRRANNASISPRRAYFPGESMRVETRTTISQCCNLIRNWRKDSRTMRLIKLRLTAERTSFFAMTTPSLAVLDELGRWSISKCLPRKALRKAKTDENSSVLRNRYSSRKPRSTTGGGPSGAPTAASDAETGPPSGTSCPNDSTSATRTHANKKPMGAFAPNYGRLVCAFHGCRLCKKRNA